MENRVITLSTGANILLPVTESYAALQIYREGFNSWYIGTNPNTSTFYISGGNVNSQSITLDTSGNITLKGGITAVGYNSSNWDTAYTNRITSLTSIGTSGPATLIDHVLNIPNYGAAGGITGSGTTNYITKFTSTTSLGNSILFDNGTNVGIGTASPTYKLDVSGSIRATSNITISTGGTGTNTFNASTNYLFANQNNVYGIVDLQNAAGQNMFLKVTGTPTVGGSTQFDYFLLSGTTTISSGTSTRNIFNVTPTYNLTSTYVGIVRGLYYNPTLTSMTGATHRAIETTSGNIIINNGNVGIGTSTPTKMLDLRGDMYIASGGGQTITIATTNNNVAMAFAGYAVDTGFINIVNNNMPYYTLAIGGYTQGINYTGTLNRSIPGNGMNFFSVYPTYNTSGTYVATVRGFYYNPTLTSTTGLTNIAIETTSGTVIFNGGNVGIGTSSPISKLQVSGSTTAVTALAQGAYFNSTLIAAAANDVLVGLDVNPIFTVNSSLINTVYGLRVAGNYTPATYTTNNNAVGISISTAFTNTYSAIGLKISHTYSNVQSGYGILLESVGGVGIYQSSTTSKNIFAGSTSIGSNVENIATTFSLNVANNTGGAIKVGSVQGSAQHLIISHSESGSTSSSIRNNFVNSSASMLIDVSAQNNLKLFGTGNVTVGNTVDNGGKLQIKAPGNLSTDIALKVRDSADAIDLLTIDGTGAIKIKNNTYTGTMSFAQTANSTSVITGGPASENITFGPSNRIFLNASQVAVNYLHTLATINAAGIGGTAGNALLVSANNSFVGSTGILQNHLKLSSTVAQQNVSPIFNALYIEPTINNTTTTTAIARGIYYSPILTSLTGTTHRAIETTSGDIIFNGGQVGIGSSSFYTETKLKVKGANSGLLFLVSGDSYGVRIGANSTAGFISGVDHTGFGSDQALQFRATKYQFDLGNLLINTITDAGYKLDVNGTSRFSNDVNITKSYNVKWGTNQQINVTDYPAYFTGGYNIMSFISNSTGVTADDASFIWRNGGTTSNLMVLNGVGKLGIGTVAPSEKLHVIGNIISSAKIEATTNIVAGGTVQSGAPAGYAAKAMKWGEVLAVSNPSLNTIGINYQQAVQIDGVSYYVMLSDVLQ